MFFARFFRTNVVSAAFSSSYVHAYVSKKSCRNDIRTKKRAKNVDEIDG